MGVCIITEKPICAECSTRYEGVNYSKEGLAILHARRAAEADALGWRTRAICWFAVAACPVLLGMMYLFYVLLFEGLIDIQQLRGEGF